MKLFKRISLALLLAGLLAGCQLARKTEPAPGQPVVPELPVAVVVAPFDFAEDELARAETALKAEGLPYKLVSIQYGTFAGRNGGEARVETAAAEVKPEQYRAALFLGGGGMATIADDDTLKLLAQNFARAGKRVAAVSEGNAVLKAAGFFDGGSPTGASSTPPVPVGEGEALEQIIASFK